MSFRRLPFEFSASDPSERQSELMRRFGVPPEDKMILENPNENLVHLSPRLQHRVPGYFNEFSSKENLAENVDSSRREPKVRVIPIHVEGQSEPIRPSSRSRNSSGGSAIPVTYDHLNEDHLRRRTNSGSSFSRVKTDIPRETSFVEETNNFKPKVSSGPQNEKVCNIPIVIEGRDSGVKRSRNVPIHKEVSKPKKSIPSNMGNAQCVSKSATEPSLSQCPEPLKKKEPDYKNSLKQIDSVLKELETYEKGVNEFNGKQGDKQYRYLDEMLTRCMIKLDLIETFGNEEVRQSRKAVIRRVQGAIDLLESKIQSNNLPKEGLEQTKDLEVVAKLPSNVSEEVVVEATVEKDCSVSVDQEPTEMEIDINQVHSSQDCATNEMDLEACESAVKRKISESSSELINKNETDLEACESTTNHEISQNSSELINKDEMDVEAAVNFSDEQCDLTPSKSVVDQMDELPSNQTENCADTNLITNSCDKNIVSTDDNPSLDSKIKDIEMQNKIAEL